MKPIREWTEADLQALIEAGTSESLSLEYKAPEALSDKGRSDISKFVTGFANAAGGVIIYGMREDKDSHKPTEVAGITEARFNREWLDQVIHSTIQPRISGVVIHPIKLGSGGVALVVEVPAATDGPHQSDDKRYHKRRNFHVDRMEDYEIRDVMRRATTPNLRVSLAIQRQRWDQSDGALYVALKMMIRNLSIQPAYYTILRAFVDARCQVSALGVGWSGQGNTEMFFRTTFLPMATFQQSRKSPEDMPIFKEEIIYPGDIEILIPHNLKRNEPAVVAITANTPGSTITRYWELLFVGNGKVGLSEVEFDAPSFKLID